MANISEKIGITLSEEEKKKSLKNKTAKDVINDLKDIERRGQTADMVDAPESLGLERMEFEEKSDDELSALAKSTLDSKYNSKKKETNDSFESKVESLIKENENKRQNLLDSSKKVNEVYDESIKSTENQALRRGLARSSVIINQVAGLEESKASELSEILKSINDNLSETESKLNELQTEKDRALSDLDIEYALELQSEIENVKSDYEKEKQKAIEFNNNVEKLEAEYKLKLEDKKLEKQKQNATLKDKYGENYAREEIKDKQYEYLKEYLDAIDKDYALKLLTLNKEFLNILGENRYNLLLGYVEAR